MIIKKSAYVNDYKRRRAILDFFSPGFKASRKSGSTKTQIKTFSRSKVDPETVKKYPSK